MAPLVATTTLTVPRAVEVLTRTLEQHGVPLLATIDHAAGARDAGLELHDEVLLVFGNPAVGTAVMQADPRAGLDLPLRLLVWAGGSGTQLAFHDPHELAESYHVDAAAGVLDKLRGLLDALVVAAGGSATAGGRR